MPLGPGGLDSNGIWLYGEDDSEALASDLLNLGMQSVSDALGAGFGKILDLKSVIKTDTFSSSVSGGADVAVTDLSITHTLANSSNKLLLMAYFGTAATSQNDGRIGISFADGGTKIGVGDAASTRSRVGAGGQTSYNLGNEISVSPAIHFLYSPGDTAAHTYTVLATNMNSATKTLYVNRTVYDLADPGIPRGASSFTLMEVAP